MSTLPYQFPNNPKINSAKVVLDSVSKELSFSKFERRFFAPPRQKNTGTIVAPTTQRGRLKAAGVFSSQQRASDAPRELRIAPYPSISIDPSVATSASHQTSTLVPARRAMPQARESLSEARSDMFSGKYNRVLLQGRYRFGH